MADNITMADVQKPDTLMNISTVASDYKKLYNKCLELSTKNAELTQKVEELDDDYQTHEQAQDEISGLEGLIDDRDTEINALNESHQELMELNKKLLDRNSELEAAAKDNAVGHKYAALGQKFAILTGTVTNLLADPVIQSMTRFNCGGLGGCLDAVRNTLAHVQHRGGEEGMQEVEAEFNGFSPGPVGGNVTLTHGHPVTQQPYGGFFDTGSNGSSQTFSGY